MEKMPDERTFLAFDRTLLAWVRTATSLAMFGIALIQLLEQQVIEHGENGVFRYFSPRLIGFMLISSGFLGLLIAVIQYVQFCRKHRQTARQIYTNPSILQSFVILALCTMLIVGTALS